MNIYEALLITTFVMFTIMMICQHIDTNVPRLCEVLQLINILPCYEIKVYRDGRRLTTNGLMKYINSSVKDICLIEGILYITIY